MRSKYMLIIAFCWLSVTITTAQIDQKPIGFWQFDEGKGAKLLMYLATSFRVR